MSTPTHTQTPRASRSILARIGQQVPTVLIIATLAGIGLWGHHSDWTLPKFSELMGEKPEPKDWCEEHNVPESICVECKPDLMPSVPKVAWCTKHGVPQCTWEHPELAQLNEPYRVSAEDLARAERSLEFAERPENFRNCNLHERRIQFENTEAAEKSGVEVMPVSRSNVTEFISAPAEIQYDQTRVAHLASRSTGTVWQVFKHIGEVVKPGDVLALIDSNDVGKAKSELLQSVALLQLKSQVYASLRSAGGAVPESRVREAEAAVRETEIRIGAARQALVNLGLPIEQSQIVGKSAEQLEAELHFYGLPADVAKTLNPKKTTSNLLPLIAPIEGTITSRDVVVGEVVESSRILFEVVDTRRLWIMFDVKAEEAKQLKLGLPVRFKPDGNKAELMGKLNWISTQADPKTRTVKARAELADPERKQQANVFGAGRIILRDEQDVVAVPNAALHTEGCCTIVFVRDKNYLKDDAPKVFHVRVVRVGARTATHTEIIAGLLPGELVATSGSGAILSQLLRANLGAGCACHQ